MFYRPRPADPPKLKDSRAAAWSRIEKKEASNTQDIRGKLKGKFSSG